MTTHVCFHRADLDGIGSCMVILRHLLELKIEGIRLHAYNYGEPMPKFEENDVVYIADISFLPEDMKGLYFASLEGLLNVTWLDHHKTSYDESIVFGYDNMGGVRNLHRPAAIEVCWYYFQRDQAPEGVRLLSKYDTWCNEDKLEWSQLIMPYQFGMRNVPWLKRLMDAQGDTERLRSITRHFFDVCNDTDEVLVVGEVILKYQQGLNAAASAAAFRTTWKGVVFAVINGTGNSQLFEKVDFDHQACMLFRFSGKSMKWMFSLYGKDDDNEIDLSVLAKEMGGGGHKKACGFDCETLSDVFGEVMA